MSANPFALPERMKRPQMPHVPAMLDVRMPPDISARLLVMGSAGLNYTEILADAAREGVRSAFDAFAAGLPEDRRARVVEAARRGDDDAAAAIALRIRMLEDARRNEAERQRLDAIRAEQARPKPRTPEEQVADAAMPWLEQTAAEGWLGDFTAAHRDAVIATLEGKPMGWPFRQLACDGPFLAAVRKALGVSDDATLDPVDLATVRAAVERAKAARAKALNTGPRGASVSTVSIGRGR